MRVKALKNAGTFHISAGGDSCVAIRVVRGSVLSRPAGTLPRLAQHGVSAEQLMLVATRATSMHEFVELRRTITDTFSHPAALNASFLKGQGEAIWCVCGGRDGNGPGTASVRGAKWRGMRSNEALVAAVWLLAPPTQVPGSRQR